MIPKEKAKELFNKYFKILSVDDSNEDIYWKQAKVFALIAVDVILDCDCHYWASDGVSGKDLMIDAEYWEEVKKEINYL